MISAQDLQKVKLKATEESSRSDRSAPQLRGEEPSREKENERREYFFDTGLDRWYSSLKDTTFLTEFLPITPDEARAIVSYWDTNFKDRNSADEEVDGSSIDIPPSLNGLRDRIGSTIASLSPDKGAFVKLTTRSPKDSHVAFAKAHKTFDVRKLLLGPSPSVNDLMILLGEVVIESLKVTSGEDAIKLLVSSTRVGEDLEYALAHGDQDFCKRTAIVLREWVDIPLWAEFRGFVWDGKLTSIGQYNHPVCFPQLLHHASEIESNLQAFFASVKDRIPLSRYIVDFAWTPSRVYLVEVNPFDGEVVFPASTGLWSWEKDRQKMMNGPLELRIRLTEQSARDIKSSLDPQWRAVIF